MARPHIVRVHSLLWSYTLTIRSVRTSNTYIRDVLYSTGHCTVVLDLMYHTQDQKLLRNRTIEYLRVIARWKKKSKQDILTASLTWDNRRIPLGQHLSSQFKVRNAFCICLRVPKLYCACHCAVHNPARTSYCYSVILTCSTQRTIDISTHYT